MKRGTSPFQPIFFHKAENTNSINDNNSLNRSIANRTPRHQHKNSLNLSNKQNELVDMRQSFKTVNNMSLIYDTAKQLNTQLLQSAKSSGMFATGQLSPTLCDEVTVNINRSTKWMTKERKIAAEKIDVAMNLRTKYTSVPLNQITDVQFLQRFKSKDIFNDSMIGMRIKENDFEVTMKNELQNSNNLINFNKLKNALNQQNQQNEQNESNMTNGIRLEELSKRIEEKKHELDNIQTEFIQNRCVSVFPQHKNDSLTNEELPSNDDYVIFEMNKGVYQIKNKETNEVIFAPFTLTTFLEDYQNLLKIIDYGPCKTFASERMAEIHHCFELHRTFSTQKSETEKDFFTQNKVETHIHAEQCVTEKELISFMEKQLEKNEIVNIYIDKDGNKKEETLKEVFDRIGLSTGKLSLHKMELRAHHHFFPEGNDLKELFLSIDNHIEGKYFAELVKGMLNSVKDTHCFFELRLPIDGRKTTNWNDLSEWVDKYDLYTPHNKWIIQFPKRFKEIQNGDETFTFTRYLQNIFKPLFEVSKNPQSNIKLSKFLENVSGFDLVGKENEVEPIIGNDTFDPNIWTKSMNPSYYIYMYYLFMNIVTLNLYRSSRGLSTFDFRPHCGEGGHYSHLAAAFLTAQGISQGIKLVDSPTLKYLYLISQIGISMSPMANHLKGFSYDQHPYDNLFKRGLNITLSSDEPLQVHRTQEPLMEEFAMAKQTWGYEDVDLIEMCVNSINQSGYSLRKKRELIGNIHDSIITERNQFRKHIITTEKKILYALIHENKNNLFEDIPYTVVDVNYKTKDNAERDLMRMITYWMSVRGKYKNILDTTKEENDQEENNRIIDEPTVPQLFCAMSGGIINVYNTPDAVCDVDKYHESFCYCFDCRKNYCKKCFKLHHKDHYHSIRRIKQNCYFMTPSYSEYISDYINLSKFTQDGPTRTFCYKQLLAQQEMFKLHKILNNSLEVNQIKQLPIDFEKSIKVDCVVSAPRSSHPRDLLTFIKEKKETDADRVVFPELTIHTEDGTRVYKQVTLKNAFTIYNIEEISLDKMSVTFDRSLIQRYDLWETRNTIFNVKEFRDLFLTPNNYVNGEYFCEFLKQTHFESKSAKTRKNIELHMCVYGESPNEMENLSKTIVSNGLIYPQTNYFSVQITRKYVELKKTGKVSTFEELLNNIFRPLFEASLNPEKYPEIDKFLSNVGSFDCKGDESMYDGKTNLETLPRPSKWESFKEPPFAYWMFYVYSNVNMLNHLRQMLGLNTFDFKPHCGETGDPMNNNVAFLLADSISHGSTLNDQNTLQYLFGLAQIGIICCPIYDKFLYDVIDHPFYKFFMRGLKVTLSTDSPLHTHTTKEPLVEEYASAIKHFKLTFTDIAEITRNSLDISSFPEEFKVSTIYDKSGVDMMIPKIRLDFRKKSRQMEFDKLMKFCLGRSNISMEEQETIQKLAKDL